MTAKIEHKISSRVKNIVTMIISAIARTAVREIMIIVGVVILGTSFLMSPEKRVNHDMNPKNQIKIGAIVAMMAKCGAVS